VRAHAGGQGKGEKRRNCRKGRSRAESDLAIFPPSVYLPFHRERVHLHGNSPRGSLPKVDAYKSTVPFHARERKKERLKRLPRGAINCDRGERKTEGRRGRRSPPPSLSSMSDRIFGRQICIRIFFHAVVSTLSLFFFSLQRDFARGF